jgi:phosphoglycolate phosphatase
LLAACRTLGERAGTCIYVGDDQRDIEAAHAAGMKGVAAKWGYLNGQDPENWNADWLIDHPRDLQRYL